MGSRIPILRRTLFLVIATLIVVAATRAQEPVRPNQSGNASSAPLPDAPSITRKHPRQPVDPCAQKRPSDNPEALSAFAALHPCKPVSENPYMRFLNSTAPHPLTPAQKAHLAARNVIDPFNILTIVASSGFSVAVDSHSPYGPGFHGFATDTGVSFSQDVTGEFIGTFAVCSIFHEDPHYHREPDRTTLHRLYHAFGRTVIAQHDDGTVMPNYQNFITYPAGALLANLYVPGVATDGPSTVKRIMIDFATDPINNLITEFLPDIASHIHIHIVFVQQILNKVAAGPNAQF